MPCCFDDWLEESRPFPDAQNVVVLTEREGARAAAMPAIHATVRDHFYGAELLAGMDYQRAAQVVREALPASKRTRSGDLAEMFATEYVANRTEFRIPLKRLRYKDDRELALRGTDIIGLRAVDGRQAVLKGEAKSRADLQDGPITEACDSLTENDSRPKPATLAFMSRMLRMAGRDDDAVILEDLQTRQQRYEDITHMVFAMSGNDPSDRLKGQAAPRPPIADRRFIGMRIADHQAFIANVFDTVDAAVG